VNVVLWVLQSLLALAFIGAGAGKLSQPKDKLKAQMEWVNHTSETNVKLVGAVEVIGGLGVILPAVTKIATVLVPIAAVGLAITMALALLVHVRLHDPIAKASGAIILFVLAVVVAWGRFAYPL
jgi:uncharacterized membrane protein YphA (DoxX/SURF4 family)